MKAVGLNEDDLDDDDSEYDFHGGDMSLYESRLDKVDEIQTLKETLGFINQTSPIVY
jgi:hypothetical protein